MADPLIVVEGSQAAVDRVRAELRAAGWSLVDGWTAELPRGSRWVRVGVVASPADAAQALLAVLSGCGAVIDARAGRDIVDRLVDDLRRLGPVDHRTGEPAVEPNLPAESRAVLGLLAEGYSLGEAAKILGLARRTADRRLAEARRILGVERTTEAIAHARRRGWLARGNDAGTQ
jgi:DNA-binding CsgD family transcriptional regulator